MKPIEINYEPPKKKKNPKPPTKLEKLKYEIAGELGLMDKVEKTGWKSLTARESGKIGGLVASRRRNEAGS